MALIEPEPLPSIDQAIRRIDRAIERDPSSLRLHRQRSRYYSFRAKAGGSDNDLSTALSAAAAVLSLYPNDPASHILLADAWAARGLAKMDKGDINQAIGHLEQALGLDDARPDSETVRRLRPAECAILDSRIQSLRSALGSADRQPRTGQ